MRFNTRTAAALGLALNLILLAGCLADQDQKQAPAEPQPAARSTQPTIDRQLDTPSSAGSAAAAAAAKQESAAAPVKPAESAKPTRPKIASPLRKASAASLAAQQNYDKYQLKATNSYNSHSTPAASSVSPAPATGAPAKESDQKSDSLADSLANKKAASVQPPKQKQSSFSILRKLLPSFMTSAAGPMAAAAAAAASAVASDKHPHQHSRSSPPSAGEGILSRASGKVIQMLGTKSSAGTGAVPDHAPFFVRKHSGPIDRQGGLASSLLSNPLGLGLLFSAPLIPSLLLTPLAIAGLSPAMSALNNFFGDDEEASTPASSGPLASFLAGGGASPLSGFLSQASGSSSESASSAAPSFALQAVQSLLGPTSTTERPLFNPGLFANQGIQNAAASLASAASNAVTGGSGSQGGSASPSRGIFGGGAGGSLMQAAASMISPSFAAPPSATGAASTSPDDERSGFMQVASDVFDKVASYMGSPDTDKDLAQASSSPTGSTAAAGNQVSPISALVGLSNFSPFQLSSLLASSPLAAALTPSPSQASGSAASGSSAAGSPTQKAGFFSTLRNVYELFSSSFLLRRNQEVGGLGSDPNECKQRLVCELHQRAMNSKLFRRSLDTNLMELANLDRSLQEQLAGRQSTANSGNSLQARVDSETKQMLNDFLKATSNFRAGRELVNCSKMYPKCSRVQLLAAANAHLTDPASGKAIGKFSSLMKKMKFKSAQQHQSQWKLRKPSKASGAPTALAQPSVQYQPSDYLQVAPLSAKSQPGQLTPADSLKLVQQIMLMSQQQQQPQQQVSAANQYAQPMGSQQMQYRQPQQLAPAQAQPIAYQNYASYPQQAQPQPQTTYTDAVSSPQQPHSQPQQVANLYSSQSSTDSPYYFSQPPAGQQQYQSSVEAMSPVQQQQPMMQNTYPSASSAAPSDADKTQRQQQPVGGKAIVA